MRDLDDLITDPVAPARGIVIGLLLVCGGYIAGGAIAWLVL